MKNDIHGWGIVEQCFLSSQYQRGQEAYTGESYMGLPTHAGPALIFVWWQGSYFVVDQKHHIAYLLFVIVICLLEMVCLRLFVFHLRCM